MSRPGNEPRSWSNASIRRAACRPSSPAASKQRVAVAGPLVFEHAARTDGRTNRCAGQESGVSRLQYEISTFTSNSV